MSNNKQYFASLPPKELIAELSKKLDVWQNKFKTNGYQDKLIKSWEFYYGIDKDGSFSDAHTVKRAGEQGELSKIKVNHFRNIGQNMLVMTTASRPTVETRSVNTDYKSQTQARLANGIVEYYLREKNLEDKIRQATEYAIVLGSGFIKLDWDPTKGEEVDYNPETKQYIYEGDVEFTVLSPLDVVVDSTREGWNNDWIITRSYKNKWDLAAKYPDMAEKIKDLSTKSDEYKTTLDRIGADETDDVAVYEFIHKRTDAMPDGRYFVFCGTEVDLIDSPFPYRTMNVLRICPSTIMGTPYGYTTLFDCLPIQEAVDALYSAVLSNNLTFSVQNIIVPEGGGLDVSAFSTGMNFISVDMQKGMPQALQLTQSSPETYSLIGTLVKEMETISGVNSVVRGNPEASLKSGSALALVQAQAIQFMSGLQHQYVRMVEDTATGLMKILQDFAQTKRIAAIVGKDGATRLKEFKGDDLDSINRVVCTVGNPLAKTTGGKLGIADQLLQYGLLEDPKQYLTLIETGSLDNMIDNTVNDDMNIRHENEMLMDAEKPIAVYTDKHSRHIVHHKSVLDNPEIRKNPDVVRAVLDHIAEHEELLRTVSPELLEIIGEKSIAQPQPAPGQAPQGVPQDAVPTQTQENQMVSENLDGMAVQGEELVGPGMGEGVNIPQPPEA